MLIFKYRIRKLLKNCLMFNIANKLWYDIIELVNSLILALYIIEISLSII